MKNDLTAEQLQQEVTVTLPLSVVLKIGETPPEVIEFTVADKSSLPAIGEPFGGGIYAGMSIEDEGPVALVLLPGDEELKWKEAIAWAEKQGGVLPSRVDQLVLLKNLKREFQGTWYWSGELYAGNESYAWCQGFSYGNQSYGHKISELRARAVRRLTLAI